jgi:hypothetical protein
MFAGALISLMMTRALASTEILGDFKLKSCGESAAGPICVSIDTDEARRSPLDRAFAFRRARIEVRAGSARPAIFEVSSGYYDPTAGYLVMHGRPGGLVNLTTGRITRLDDPPAR